MDLQMLDQMPSRLMTADEEATSRAFYEAVQLATNQTARSIQASGHRVGVSDLGHCSERVRRHLLGQQEPETDKTAAFIGTALGDHIEGAYLDLFPNMIRQAEIAITLYGDTGTYVLTGHPDLIDPAGRLIDVKTTRGLGRVRKTGPSQQQQFQRHLYAKASHQAGLFDDDVALTDVLVSNVWFDRAGDDREPYVHQEPYDERVVEAATAWLDDVVYAYQHGEEARKEPPIQMCEKACGFFLDCRVGRGGPQGLIEDPDLLAAVEMQREAMELERRARRLKDEAKAALAGIEGSTGAYTVKWVKVTGAHVEYDRAPYQKLDIRPIR
jgi:hypothetical protein